MSADWDDVRTETIIHAAARLRRFGDLLSTKVVAAKLKVNKDVLYKRKSSGHLQFSLQGDRNIQLS